MSRFNTLEAPSISSNDQDAVQDKKIAELLAAVGQTIPASSQKI